MTPKRRKKSLVKWAGFVNDKIDSSLSRYNDYKIYAIYFNRKNAKRAYEDVRKVLIQEL